MLFKRKLIYEKDLLDTIKSLNEFTLENITNPDERNMISFPVQEINRILEQTALETKSLILDKGFLNTLRDGLQKIVLLNTEISELADAVKKGFGPSYEGEEIADIIIRSCNFLCSEETFFMYNSLCKTVSSDTYKNEFIMISTDVSFDKSIIDKKYFIIKDMMNLWTEISYMYELLHYNIFQNKDSNTKSNESLFVCLWDKILRLTCQCKLYCDTFLPKKMHEYIDIKMTKNFERPYRYNSCREMFK